jgi:SnoaL-like polyketide cyclase
VRQFADESRLLHHGPHSAARSCPGCRPAMDMTHPVDRMLRLWSVPPPDDELAALSAFREVYFDPYSVNGEDVPLGAVVDRARMMHAGLTGLRHEVLDRIDSGDRTVLVMRQMGRHTGPLSTQLGTWQPTGVSLERRIIEVITVEGDRLRKVWVTGDDLGRLIQADAVRLVRPGTE